MRIRGLVWCALTLSLATCGGDEAAKPVPPPHHGLPRVQERIAILRPHVEAVMGCDLPEEIAVSILGLEEYGERLALELTGGTQTGTEVLGALLFSGGAVFQHVTPQGEILRLGVPADDETLDLDLLRALVLVNMSRRFDVSKGRTSRNESEALLVRMAAQTGFLRRVCGEIADRAGLTNAFREAVRKTLGGLERIETEAPVSSYLDQLMRNAAATDRFLHRAADEFVAVLVEDLGQMGATERIYTAPPLTVHDLANPRDYIATPESLPAGYELAMAMRRVLEDETEITSIEPMVRSVLRAELLHAGPREAEKALVGFRYGQEIRGEPGGDESFGVLYLRLRIVGCTGESAADRIRAIWDEARTCHDELGYSPGARDSLASKSSSEAEVDGQATTITQRLHDDGGSSGWARSEQLLITRGGAS